MASWDDLKNTFFDECHEAIEAIEAGLTDMRHGTHTSDTINAVFRAVHSVKGGAGVFGFEFLVRFAHVFETVLDAMRQETLSITPTRVELLLGAGDVLGDLVDLARKGQEPDASFGEPMRAALEDLIPEQDGAGDADIFDGIDFVPVMAQSDDRSEAAAIALRISPRVPLFDDLESLADAFRALNEAGGTVIGDEADMPALSDLDLEKPFLFWTVRGSVPREKIDEILAPVAAFIDVADLEEADETSLVPDIGEAPPLLPSADDLAPPPPAIVQPLPDQRDAAEAQRPPAVVAGAAPATIRVDLDKIDRVVNMVGELVIAQAMLVEIVDDVPEIVSHRLTQVLEELHHYTRELKSSVMSMRAQPVRSVFQRMTRLVRDLAAKTGKRIELEMSGENTEVDKTIIERLSDPLTHIIRNSIDHGLETPQERLEAGKSEVGKIRLSATQRGGRIVIEIADDGGGIDSAKVLHKAKERGLVGPDAALSDDDVNNLIFLPGFSTADVISDISGRGVGMDVVRRNIQDLGGRVSLTSERGRGTSIQLALPLTLAVMDGMIFKSAGETYVMPISSIVECLRISRSEIHALVGTRGTMRVRECLIPLIYLSDVFNLDAQNEGSDECAVIIVEAADGGRVGLVVDEFGGHQQVVIKSIEENWKSVPGIAAATILGNGRVAFIVDVEKLFELETNLGSPANAGEKRPLLVAAES